MEEIFKPIPDFPDYEVSNKGNVRSFKTGKGHLLSKAISNKGYPVVSLCRNGIQKLNLVHQLVAMAFLGHKPNGHRLVINHINFKKTDNRVGNLEVVTLRENSNMKHLESSSKYVGVSWNSRDKKWRSQIYINKEAIYLGSFDNELDAHNAYQDKLKEILKETSR